MPTRKSTPDSQEAPPHGGFYGRSFNRLDLADLEDALGEGLANEIAMLRVATRRLFEKTNDLAFKESLQALHALGSAAMRLAYLLRTHTSLHSTRKEHALAAIHQALDEAIHEMKLRP